MECEEFILPDWSPPDDPASVLAAKGRLNPSDSNGDDDIEAQVACRCGHTHPPTHHWGEGTPLPNAIHSNLVFVIFLTGGNL